MMFKVDLFNWERAVRKSQFFLSALIMLSITWAGFTQQRGVRIIVKTKDGENLPLYQLSHALVVGVSDYTNGWPDLPSATRDATVVAQELTKHGFQVELLKNPTKRELDDALKDFAFTMGVNPEDRLLFYFAGHGYTMQMAYGAKMGFIVPSDAPLPDIDVNKFMRKAVSMQSFENNAHQIQAKHVLYLFDSCFSGSIFALTRAIPSAITYKTGRPVRQFITAGDEEEEVPDKSVFNRQFIEALKGEGDLNRDGYITGTELGEFLQTTIVNYSRETQHPQYGKIRDPNLDKGDFVFASVMGKAEKKKLVSKDTEDSVLPRIINNTVDEVKEGGPLRIEASVTDNVGISKVFVAYTSPVKKSNNLSMVSTFGDFYSVNIPVQDIKPPGLEYVIAAYDLSNNMSICRSPDGKNNFISVKPFLKKRRNLGINVAFGIIGAASGIYSVKRFQDYKEHHRQAEENTIPGYTNLSDQSKRDLAWSIVSGVLSASSFVITFTIDF